MKKKKMGKKAPQEPSNGTADFRYWKPHLDAYRELSSLTFSSDSEIEKGIDLLWTDDLRTLPHDLTDGYTIIVPKEAVEYFVRAGLKFRERRVRRSSEVPPEELAKLRNEQGIF